MILLIQSSQEYNNDLRAMIMAFYPGVKIVENRDKADSVEFVFCAEYGDINTILRIDGSDGKKRDDLNAVIEGNYLDKATFRNKIKMASYRLLCTMTNRVLPWGDLTGVRPTKIAMSELGRGKSISDTIDNYVKEYDVSERKARLATEVALNEMSLTKGIDLDKSYSLYVGIPFCPSRCLYCSFASYPISLYQDKSIKYIDKLCEELALIANAYRHKKLVSIYIGGGTPTSINHELLDKLLSAIDYYFEPDFDKGFLEYTIEAGRPDSITPQKLEVMKKHRVGRISINPQTMNDATLKTIGRAHTAKQTEEAFYLARSHGFDNINMDLIAGLPGENLDSMRYTLDKLRCLNPESITVHSLAIKRAANLRQQMDTFGDTINQDMDEMHNMAAELSRELGMKPYYLYRQKNIGGNLENVGYAKPGCECLYNVLIMEEMMDIIAAGAGAATKLVFNPDNGEEHGDNSIFTHQRKIGDINRCRIERIENCKSVDDYIDRFEEMIARKQFL